MKYLIMKVKRSYAIALAEDDTFYVVANRNYQVGEYVTNPIIMKEYVEKTQRSLFGLYKKGLALGLGLAMAFIMVFGYSSYLDTVVGSYVIHAESIVEIAVNRSGLVDGIIAKNGQGKKLIEGYNFKNKTKEVVMRELIERSKEFGYVNEHLDISVNSDARYYQKLKDDLCTIIVEFEDDGFEFEINYEDDSNEFEDDIDDVEEDETENDIDNDDDSDEDEGSIRESESDDEDEDEDDEENYELDDSDDDADKDDEDEDDEED